jgi:hypothetical protein
MARRPIAPNKVLDVVAEQYGVRRERAAVRVEHYPVTDRPLVAIDPDDDFWFDSEEVWFSEHEIRGAIVWVKPPPTIAAANVAIGVACLREAGALVRLLPADRVNQAPRVSGSEARVQELQVSDSRACCAELARELAGREGVDVEAVMDAVEQSLSAAGI